MPFLNSDTFYPTTIPNFPTTPSNGYYFSDTSSYMSDKTSYLSDNKSRHPYMFDDDLARYQAPSLALPSPYRDNGVGTTNQSENDLYNEQLQQRTRNLLDACAENRRMMDMSRDYSSYNNNNTDESHYLPVPTASSSSYERDEQLRAMGVYQNTSYYANRGVVGV